MTLAAVIGSKLWSSPSQVCGTTIELPLPYKSKFITIACIQVLRVMCFSGSMSIFLDNSLITRTSPSLVLAIK